MAKTNMDLTKCVEGAQKLCINKYVKKEKLTANPLLSLA